MNVYDFDKTLFPRDSSVAFYFYCLRRQPSLLRFLPRQAAAALLYVLGRTDKTAMKSRVFSYLQAVRDPQGRAEDFWRENAGDIVPWLARVQTADDVVVSASPDFLLRPICRRLGLALIASDVDEHSGRWRRENCWGEEKVLRFRAEYPDARVARFYSDSLSDTPLSRLADQRFLVSRAGPGPWPQ